MPTYVDQSPTRMQILSPSVPTQAQTLPTKTRTGPPPKQQELPSPVKRAATIDVSPTKEVKEDKGERGQDAKTVPKTVPKKEAVKDDKKPKVSDKPKEAPKKGMHAAPEICDVASY